MTECVPVQVCEPCAWDASDGWVFRRRPVWVSVWVIRGGGYSPEHLSPPRASALCSQAPGGRDGCLHVHGLLLLDQACPLHGEGTARQSHGERVLQRQLSHQLAVLLGLSQDLEETWGGCQGQQRGRRAQSPSRAARVPNEPSPSLLQFGPTSAQLRRCHSSPRPENTDDDSCPGLLLHGAAERLHVTHGVCKVPPSF